jgi:hypothetical protein
MSTADSFFVSVQQISIVPLIEQLGFTYFMPSNELSDPSRGYLVNVNAEVGVCRIVDYRLYASIKETSFLCTRNQVGTVYLGFLLQTSYHTSYFMYVILGLQNLFFKSSIATKDLTRHFGWDAHHPFMRHDVQLFTRLVCKKLGDKAKVTNLTWSCLSAFRCIYSHCLPIHWLRMHLVAMQCPYGYIDKPFFQKKIWYAYIS